MIKSQNSSVRPADIDASPMSGGSWTVIGILLLLLGATLIVAGLGWQRLSNVEMSVSDYVLLFLAVIIALAVGFGLMALLFYSSRRGYDDAPHWELPPADGDVRHSPKKSEVTEKDAAPSAAVLSAAMRRFC